MTPLQATNIPAPMPQESRHIAEHFANHAQALIDYQERLETVKRFLDASLPILTEEVKT